MCTWLTFASLTKYDTPLGISSPPSHERTRRWESRLRSQSSRSQSPNLRSSHSHSHPPSIREWNTGPERSPALSGEHDSRRQNSSHSPSDVLRVRVSCRSRSRILVKGKGKRRALARSLSPPESDISCRSPVNRHERTGSPEELVTPNLSLFDNAPERNTASSCTSASYVRPPVPQTPEDDLGDTPVVSPPHLPDGNSNIACATHTINNGPSPLNGLRSLNDEIIASSKTETPKPLSINTNRGRANPTRQPRYRSQRDAIIAHLRRSVTTSSRPTQSLLAAQVSGQTVAELNVSRDDDPNVARRMIGTPGKSREGHVHLESRAAERSSGLSGSDDPPGGSRRDPKETAVTKAGAHLLYSFAQERGSDHLPRNAGRLCKCQFFILFCRGSAAVWTHPAA